MVLPFAARSRCDGRLPILALSSLRTRPIGSRAAHCVCVDWVDEVIVVEAGSSDDTVEVAKGAGAKVIHNEWEGFGQQKRFAEDQCRNTWVLNLDADGTSNRRVPI